MNEPRYSENPNSFVVQLALFAGGFIVVGLLGFFLVGLTATLVQAGGLSNPGQMKDLAMTVGKDAMFEYRILIGMGALVIAGGLVFRWTGACVAGVLGAVGYFLVSETELLRGLASGGFRFSHATTGTSKPGTVRQMTLSADVNIPLAYGQVMVPAGTSVTVLAEEGEVVVVRLANGQNARIPRAHLR